MFGRKRSGKTARQWKDAPDPGDVDVLPDPRPDAELATSVLRRVLVEVGGDDLAGFDVAVSAVTDPLVFTVAGRWTGTVPADAAATATAVLNRWNAGHTVPRAAVEEDAAGRLRVRADSVLGCGAGVTVQQLDEWMRRALAGLSALREYLDARWPVAELDADLDADLEDGKADTDADTEADADGPAAPPVATGDITALVTDGNRYGLLGGRTPAVLLARTGTGIAGRTETKESGASGRRGNGYLRFAAGPDVALHDGTLSVTDSVALAAPGGLDADTTDWLHALCNRVNAFPGGVVAVLDGATLTCAVHRPVGSGLSDAQLSDAVTRDRVAVGETLRVLMSEIAGDTGA